MPDTRLPIILGTRPARIRTSRPRLARIGLAAFIPSFLSLLGLVIVIAVPGYGQLSEQLVTVSFAAAIYLLDIPKLMIGVSARRASLAVASAAYVGATALRLSIYGFIFLLLAFIALYLYTLFNLARIPPAKARVNLRRRFENRLAHWSMTEPSFQHKKYLFFGHFSIEAVQSIWLVTMCWPVTTVYLGFIMIMFWQYVLTSTAEQALGLFLITVTASAIYWLTRRQPQRILLAWGVSKESFYRRALRTLATPYGGLYLTLAGVALVFAITGASLTWNLTKNLIGWAVGVVHPPNISAAWGEIVAIPLVILSIWPALIFPLYGAAKLFRINIAHRRDPTVRVVSNYLYMLAYSLLVLITFLARDFFDLSIIVGPFPISTWVLIFAGAPFCAAWLTALWLDRHKAPTWNQRLERYTVFVLSGLVLISLLQAPLEDSIKIGTGLILLIFSWYAVASFLRLMGMSKWPSRSDQFRMYLLPLALELMTVYGYVFLEFDWRLLVVGPVVALLLLAMHNSEGPRATRILRKLGIVEEQNKELKSDPSS